MGSAGTRSVGGCDRPQHLDPLGDGGGCSGGRMADDAFGSLVVGRQGSSRRRLAFLRARHAADRPRCCPRCYRCRRRPPRPSRHPGGLPMTTAPTISIVGVSKRFGSTVALDQVDATFAPGVNGLLGPNGAGKTTMLRILATVLPADDGRLCVLGVDPTTGDGRLSVRRRLGYLPQEPGFHRQFSAFDFVDYVAILKEWADRRTRHDEVRRVLAVMGLTGVAGRRIRRLSGGMRRRLVIAQALLGDPALLVLDEPTVGLDP